ncbi:LytTR family transcriptional regulator [Candidatus Micrarchaeota archaeon]|nr:LytTR family transcriptional regulator [Candidatus Micrarchaeota archaeon]
MRSPGRIYVKEKVIGGVHGDKLILADRKNFTLVGLAGIVVMEARGNYTLIRFTGNDTVLRSRTLKHYEDLLCAHGFCRVSRSVIVNLAHIRSYTGQELTLYDDIRAVVSPGRIKMLMEKLYGMATVTGD